MALIEQELHIPYISSGCTFCKVMGAVSLLVGDVQEEP